MNITEKKNNVIAELLQYSLITSEEDFYDKIGVKKDEGIFINEIKRAYDMFGINPNFWLIDDQPIFHLSISDNAELEKVKTLVLMLKDTINHERYMRKLAENSKEMYKKELQFHKLLPIDIDCEKEFAKEEMNIDFLQLA